MTTPRRDDASSSVVRGGGVLRTMSSVASQVEEWPSGVVTDGRIAEHRVGPRHIALLEPVELFGECQLPAGYESDGVSAPPWAALTVTRFGTGLPAALVHDARYDPPEGEPRLMTRKQADDELYRNVRKLGFNLFNAWKIWTAVRVGGGFAWNRNPRFKEQP